MSGEKQDFSNSSFQDDSSNSRNNNNNYQSDYEKVREFTEGASGEACPRVPKPMDRAQVTFLLKMVLSEMVELAQTVSDSHDDALKLMMECLGVDPSNQPENKDDVEVVANQADAMVDAWYYMCNAAAKNGMDVSRVFNVVHQANMDKRDPKTGEFIRRESDGKVLKPEGWKPADIEAEIRRQMQEGIEQPVEVWARV